MEERDRAESAVITLRPRPPLTRADLPRLSAQLTGVDGSRTPVVVYDLGDICESTMETVDVLARLGLAARRHDLRLNLRRTNPRLRALLNLIGLEQVLPEA